MVIGVSVTWPFGQLGFRWAVPHIYAVEVIQRRIYIFDELKVSAGTQGKGLKDDFYNSLHQQ